jgi:hypothetical protein
MSESPKRPRLISLTILGLTILGVLELWKVVALTQQSALLLDLQARPDPRLRVVVALIWAAIFFWLAIALWRKKTIVHWLAPLLLAGYAAYELVLIARFAQVSIGQQRWLLYVIVAGAAILWSVWALNNSAARWYFSEEVTAVE